MNPSNAGIYVHIPFCTKKCRYCDFASIGGNLWDDSSVSRYIEALLQEISQRGFDAGSPKADSLFLGGGTPSILTPCQVRAVIESVKGAFMTAPHMEITMEMNPSSARDLDFAALEKAGVNRVSIGVQSFDDGLLKTLGRIHTAAEAVKTINEAALLFPSVSIDLIYGIPGQNCEMWRNDLKSAVNLPVDHISAYELTLDGETPMGRDVEARLLEMPPEDDIIAMFEDTGRILSDAGLFRYEISNYSRTGRHCRHNLKYWNGSDYFGFGSGAASYVNRWRSVNTADPFLYTNRILAGETAVQSAERLSLNGRAGEFVMLGLRTVEGVTNDRFKALFGADLSNFFDNVINMLADKNDLTVKKNEEGRIESICIPENRLLLQGEIAGEFLNRL